MCRGGKSKAVTSIRQLFLISDCPEMPSILSFAAHLRALLAAPPSQRLQTEVAPDQTWKWRRTWLGPSGGVLSTSSLVSRFILFYFCWRHFGSINLRKSVKWRHSDLIHQIGEKKPRRAPPSGTVTTSWREDSLLLKDTIKLKMSVTDGLSAASATNPSLGLVAIV